MARSFSRPRIFASKCLGFAACRWNGVTINDEFVEKLKEHVDYVTTCPEAEIGLGIPRPPIRIVIKKDGEHLFQPETGRDVTEEMSSYSKKFVTMLGNIDGAILKDRSPSCGLNNVKVYPDKEKASPVDKTSGFFGREMTASYPGIALETEARLSNFTIRDHFLKSIFIMSDFRNISSKPSMDGLIRFHASNKLIFMACSQKDLKVMGQITANHKKLNTNEVFHEYRACLGGILKKPARQSNNMNVLMHAFGYFKDKLSKEEKKFFLKTLDDYRKAKQPLGVPVSLIRSYIVRFGEEYLDGQTFFEPYPENLIALRDSGKSV